MARKSRKRQAEQEIIVASLYIRTALYIRLSAEDNKKRGNSIETQKMMLESHIEGKPEFMVYDTYIDNGCTGTNFLRPAFQRMLADIEAGNVNCVIVKDMSRLGRNAIDTGYYIEQYFPANNVRFISVADQYDSEQPSNMNGGIILPLKNMINEAYSLDIGRKIKSQKRQAMKDGEYIGGRAPYGYRKDPDDCHKLLVDSEAAAVIRQIFQWAYEGKAVIDIVRRLNTANVLTPSHYKKKTGEISHDGLLGKGAWKSCAVKRILTNRTYVGDMVQGKTKIMDHRQVLAGDENIIIVPGTHEAIVDRKVFETVNRRLDDVANDYRQRRKKPYPPNAFKGKLFCAHCGSGFHRQRYERKTIPDNFVYKCMTNCHIKSGGCVGVHIDERKLMPMVMDVLKTELSITISDYADMLGSDAEQKKKLETLEAELGENRARLSGFHMSIHRMFEDLQRGLLCDEDYIMLKDRREADITEVSAKISEMEAACATFKNRISRHSELRVLLKRLNRSHKISTEMMDRLVKRIEVSNKHEISITTQFDGEVPTHSEAYK